VYVWDRTNDWLKIKPEVDCDVTVVDAKLGDPGRKHENTLGRFVVKGIVTYKKKQYDILSYCGGGLKDTERDMFWKMHQEGKLVGLVIQVKYQDVTTAICADSAGRQPSLRFPRFQRVRLDKTPIELGGI
jgi:ATP-dependent DNA ligase